MTCAGRGQCRTIVGCPNKVDKHVHALSTRRLTACTLYCTAPVHDVAAGGDRWAHDVRRWARVAGQWCKWQCLLYDRKTRDALVGFDNVLAVAVLDGLTARWQLAILAGCEDLLGGGCEGGSSTIAACACWLRVTPCRSIAHFQLNPRTQGRVVVPRWHACRKTTVDDRWRRRHWACLEPGWQAVVMPGCKHTTSSMNGVQRR